MIKLSLCLIKYLAIMTSGAMEVWLHTLLIWALDGGERSASRPGLFTSEERAPNQYPFYNRRCGPQSRSSCDGRQKKLILLPEIELRFLCRPTRSLVTIGTDLFRSYSQSYVTTDGLSISLCWCQALSGAQDKIFITVRQL
jgi:hypothetical protein